MYFILSSASVTGIRTKITQNFKKIISLQLNDELDYRTIFGNTNGVVPSKYIGRGLIKLDKVVEFQTAYSYPKENLYDSIKTLCVKLFMEIKMKARPIPVLPDVVEFKDINKNEISISNIPVGVVKKTLDIASINLKDNISYLISSRNFDDMTAFIDKLLFVLSNTGTFKSFVFDTKFIYEENKYNNITYLNSNYSLKEISDYIDKIDDVLKQNSNNKKSISGVKEVLVMLIGVDKFVKSLNDEDKKLFDNIITKTKDSMKVHFMFVDSSSNLKKIEYESWYKDTVDSGSGLWIGDGFAERYSIKPTKIQQSYYELIGNKYGYIVSNGNVDFIKVIEKE